MEFDTGIPAPTSATRGEDKWGLREMPIGASKAHSLEHKNTISSRISELHRRTDKRFVTQIREEKEEPKPGQAYQEGYAFETRKVFRVWRIEDKPNAAPTS